MKGFIIYSFYTGLDETSEHFPSLRDAERAARSALHHYDSLSEVEISRHEVVPLTKDAIISILNHGGGSWSRSSAVVKVIRRRGAA